MTAPELAIAALWGAWVISWGVAARWASPAARRPPARAELLYRALTVVAAILVFVHLRHFQIGVLWATPPAVGWTLLVVELAGLAFAWWARLHLGALWSSSVTRKADHRIIDTGPYGLVRHPIYTGILVGFYATALNRGTIPALLGAVVMTVAFYVKARLEERFLGTELGATEYAAYRARIPMLVPFWPTGR